MNRTALHGTERHCTEWTALQVRYSFIKIVMKLSLFISKPLSSKTTFIPNHFHPKRDNFIKNSFIPKQFHPKPLSSQYHFHPKPLSSQCHFHPNATFIPMPTIYFIPNERAPLTIQNVRRKKKRNDKGRTINIVRVCVKASPAKGRRRLRLMPAFRVSTGLLVEHRRPKAGDAPHEG